MIKNFDEFNQIDEGFFDWLTGKNKEGKAGKKGETGSLGINLEEFYKSLEDFAKEGKTIKVETDQNHTYSKVVENIQAALKFLGYDFSKHGIDGYFGAETAAAIQKFNEDSVETIKDSNA